MTDTPQMNWTIGLGPGLMNSKVCVERERNLKIMLTN